MRLYRTKVPTIAKDVIDTLNNDGDIEVMGENKPEAEQDLIAIMDEYLKRDAAFRNQVRDYMDRRKLPYGEYGRARKALAEEIKHPLNDDVERYLARQFVEVMMYSRFVEEIYTEDRDLYKKCIAILRNHHVDEREIREAAKGRIKNEKEGTLEFEIAMEKAVRDEKIARGLLSNKK